MSDSSALRFLIAFSLCAAMAVADLKLELLGGVRAQLSQVLAPFRFAAAAPRRLSQTVKNYFSSRDALVTEKKELETRLQEQTVQLNSLDFFAAQNEELRRLLSLKKTADGEWRAAGVVRNIAHLQEERVFLDKGLTDGILPGNGVVDENGVIGQIIRVDADTSVVNLLTDANQWLLARVKRNGLLAILRGAGDGSGEMVAEYMAAGGDVVAGDVLVADGIVFPLGYPVGVVLSVTEETVYLRLRIKPKSRLTDSTAVLVYSRPPPPPEE